MAEPVAATTPRYLKTPDAAIHLGLSARTLEKHRCYGTGPVFRRLGGRIVYANRSHNVQRSALVGQASKGGCGPVEPLVGLYESDAHEDMVGLGQPE